MTIAYILKKWLWALKTIFGIFSPYGNFNAKQSHIKIYGKKGEMSKLIAAVLLFFRRTKYMYVYMKQPNFWNKFEL